uniref:U3 small nucleolar ribonucleoprotein protein IMP3-like n=1 Tax=Styela clava TaxID=7725 RepID=UPI00193AB6C9|nr:U3 small nucleolar ribonucleoprotein protein IMP3-like [Styela clava]
MRQLKYHEKKLLKKVDFFAWEADNNLHEIKILRKYRIQKREDYTSYNKLSRHVRSIARKLRDLETDDPFRERCTAKLLDKLYRMGLIPTKESLALVDKITASTFCRRRLPVMLVKLRMSQYLKMATELIEQGHIRIGTDVVTDPAYFVTRTMEDFITWKSTSKIRKHIMEFNDERDDYDFA